ncbi:uncharacterized protein L3040_000978 [Drepanopeziza brunnea f. sp. 'multigermtubi']|uniref:uncharacterized protein n=1 Tax=Drepanopeziza brunnea f. sp. 'multigermtubi' TaxID=698441 RepID=UPI002390BB22|nr:hypothetical protein L3040_000978 [Drepanopeziza brunnea f. sp. 'multigermtubi']
MFINAKPRAVSNGFETFVPNHRANLLHRRLVEMTNNDVNAWSIFRPVAPSVSDNWDHNLDEYGNNENFQVHSLYGGYIQDDSAGAQNQTVNLPRTVTFAPALQTQCQSYKNVSTSQQIYQEPAPGMNCFQRPSPMLGNDYSQLSLGRGRGSFAEFSSVRNVLKDLSYRTQSEVNNADCTPSSSSSGLSQSSYPDESSTINTPADTTDTSPNTAYSTYSPPQASVSHCVTNSSDARHSSMATANPQGWQGDLRSSRNSQNTYEPSTAHDGLPRYPQQQFHNPWTTDSALGDTWSAQSLAANTISPKMLTLNVSTPSLSSSSSRRGSVMALSDSSSAFNLEDDLGNFSGPEPLPVVEPQQPVRRPRHMLPDSVLSSRRVVPVVPSNDFVSKKNNKKRPMKESRPSNNSRRKSSLSTRSTPVSTQSQPPPQASSSTSKTSRPHVALKRVEPKPVDPETLSLSAAAVQAMHQRDSKDDFLVRSKLAGMSYKDIRRKGKFTEAESTLRGRFRTLTKHKAARVRKPEWSDNDIRLLQKGVRKYGQGLDSSTPKIPWKLVADYIADHGGSYHFGNATCRKRWDELQDE